MSESNKRDNHNLMKKIPLLLSLFFVCIIVLCFLYSLAQLIKEPSNVFAVEEGKIYEEETTSGYIVRDESVLSGENYRNGLDQIKTEGTKVSKGENVFRYYSNNEESLKAKIEELDLEISEALKSQTGIYSADIQLLDKQIDSTLEKLLASNNISDISEYKSNISEALIKKAKIAGELSPAGSYINSLIEKRRGYEEELNNGQEYIKADMSGVISYKIDGLEETLTVENLSNLNKKTLESYNLKTGQMIGASSESR